MYRRAAEGIACARDNRRSERGGTPTRVLGCILVWLPPPLHLLPLLPCSGSGSVRQSVNCTGRSLQTKPLSPINRRAAIEVSLRSRLRVRPARHRPGLAAGSRGSCMSSCQRNRSHLRPKHAITSRKPHFIDYVIARCENARRIHFAHTVSRCDYPAQL